ncbi:MAG: site-specific integrase [Thermoplasmata archaeon]|nr:site-specific integrase [Thermoplasmata archaeon]
MKPEPTATERKALLLRNPDVSVWIKGRPRVGTGVTQLDHLRIFLDRTRLDPEGLIAIARKDPRKLRNVVLDFVREEQDRGLKAKYVVNIWWSVRSFLRSVDAAPDWNPPVEDREADEDTSRVVPRHEQVREIANAVKSARDRMVVLVLASSGIRIGTLGTQNGEPDGLRLKNLIDLELDPEPHFAKSPPMLRVPAFLSKGKAGYYSGITPDTGEAVIVSLKERLRRGEKLTPDSPLVVPDARGTRESRKSKDGQTFIVRKSLATRIQAAMDTVAPKGIRWTPHSLRAFCSTALEAAEGKGLVSKTRREYFIGHALGSTDSRYNLGRALSPEKVEELRGSYLKCLPALSLTGRREEVDIKTELLASLAEAVERATGKKADSNLKGDELAKAIRQILGSVASLTTPAPEPTATAPAKRIGEQRVIDAESVGSYLSAGWTFKSPLNGTKAVVECGHSRSKYFPAEPACVESTKSTTPEPYAPIGGERDWTPPIPPRFGPLTAEEERHCAPL